MTDGVFKSHAADDFNQLYSPLPEAPNTESLGTFGDELIHKNQDTVGKSVVPDSIISGIGSGVSYRDIG